MGFIITYDDHVHLLYGKDFIKFYIYVGEKG